MIEGKYLRLDDKTIKDFICNETSYFALSVIDIKNQEVIYSNKAMKNIMADVEAKKCWQSIYGEESVCSWCKIKDILAFSLKNFKADDLFEYEHFNEYANKWYKVQNKVTKLETGKDILISIMIDISNQKEAQGELINTQVKLIQQAQKLEESEKKLKRLASTDSMTNLYNRRYFIKTSKHLLELAKRDKEDISVIILDIDKFKNINDTYGHKVGDDVIILLAKKLLEYTRKSDIVCRFGGEEFVVLLPKTDIDGAMVISDKLRQNVEELFLDSLNNKNIKFTISIGVSQIDLDSDKDVEEAIIRADRALYEAKNSGRNRVCKG